MTVKRVEVYKVNVMNSGAIYEEDPKRAYAWELSDLLARKSTDSRSPNFSDMLMIVENFGEVIQLLKQYANTRYGGVKIVD